MIKRLCLTLLALPLFLSGQYHFSPINQLRTLGMESQWYGVLDSDSTELALTNHSSIRPLRSAYRIGAKSEEHYGGLKNWFNRKAFQEHLVQVDREDYALTLDPIVNLQLGAEQGEERYRFINTRGFHIEGRIGSQFSFYSTFQENQGRFADYLQNYSAIRRVIPGQSSSTRSFGDQNDALDYTLVSAEITYNPNRFFTFTAGQGRNFLGEGYRSVLLSDASFSYPFFRIQTSFWRFKYMNLWGQMNDLRRDAQVYSGVFAKKFFSAHYLSANITERWNISFFEAIMYGDTNQLQGLDVSFLNPVIFYRPVEFATGSRNGNALLGAASSYRFKKGLLAYTQFVLDEFNFAAIQAQEGSWLNKYAFQLGLKYHNAWGIEGLFQRLEYNMARPHTFQHREVLTNYAHYGSPLAHPWGANFHELIWQNIYQSGRWEGELQVNYGRIGNDVNGSNWGTDVYQSYETREQDLNNYTGQGDAANYYFAFLRGAYLVNPSSGLKLELGFRFRQYLPEGGNGSGPMLKQRSGMLIFGLRTEMFNRYYDL